MSVRNGILQIGFSASGVIRIPSNYNIYINKFKYYIANKEIIRKSLQNSLQPEASVNRVVISCQSKLAS